MLDRTHVEAWLDELKEAWEGGDVERAVSLFHQTTEYYERPFRPGTSEEEIRGYWRDIHGLKDIRFDYTLSAVDGNLAVVHWQNSFVTPRDNKAWLLDGVFFLEFNETGKVVVFRQWWFAAE